MAYTILFALVLVLITFYRYRKIKTIDISMLLLILYSIVSILCVYEYATRDLGYRLKVWDLNSWDIRFWPYVYLLVVFLLFMRPLFKTPSGGFIKHLTISRRLQEILIFLIILYAISAIISVYFSISSFSNTLKIGDFGEVYNEDVQQYANVLDGLVKRYTEYFRPIVFMSTFYFIYKARKHKELFVGVFFISVFCSLMISALNASRSGAFNLVMLVIICLVLFWSVIQKKERMSIILASIAIAVVFIGYSYLVTVARFEDDSTSSSLFYFGHSFLAFNYGIANRLPYLSQGTYLFDWFLPFFGIKSIPPSPTNVTGLFVTFIGSLYRDFGTIGTVVVAFLFPLIISKFTKPKKGVLDFASLYLIVFYAWRLMSGVFVYGKAEGFLWFVAFLIFYFLRFLSNSSYKKSIKVLK